ncbi:MAG: ABC transporter ATP-binding protein [Candidatus Aminicenantes bacterium]|nr:MAG: ABC transporter ATP-binding protein [Candidatus Aminicenantes bacterium]
MEYLELINLTFGYEKDKPVLNNFSLSVSKGDFFSILGPSGCGKTTIIRTIAGFLELRAGKIKLKGRDYTYMPPHKRNFGLVYQSYALFPHFTVFQNLAFGLKIRKLSEKEIHQKIISALILVNLKGLEKRYPGQLSGGQKQRVALARALVVEPDLLLLDEPLSNLDAKLRDTMRSELRRLQKEVGITTIYVTHDLVEALALSDKIVIINQGKPEQIGTPEVLFYNPKSLFVANFMGFQELARGRVIKMNERMVEMQVEDEVLKARRGAGVNVGSIAILVNRVGSFEYSGKQENKLKGRIISKIFQGDTALYFVSMGESLFRVEMPLGSALWKEEDTIVLGTDPNLCIAFPAEE